MELKNSVQTDLLRIESDVESGKVTMTQQFVEMKDSLANNQIAGLVDEIKKIQVMEGSQNHVIKECHDQMKYMNRRMVEIEKTDFDDKFNHITRKMIGEVVRSLLTPVQLGMNLEIKDIKKVIEEHAYSMEIIEELVKEFKEEMGHYRLKNFADVQNSSKEKESYLRELTRMQKLDHIRV